MPSPRTEDLDDLVPTSAHERLNVETLPHEKLSAEDLKKN